MTTQLDLTHGPKDRILIERMDNKTKEIYNALRNDNNVSIDSLFSASKTRKVYPSSLIKKLEVFKDLCDSKSLKKQIEEMIIEVSGMCSGGNAKRFIKQESEKNGSRLEFVCAVLYKYDCPEGEACGKCGPCKDEGCEKRIVCGSCKMCNACIEPIKCKRCKSCKADKECEEPIPCGECKLCERCQKVRSCGRCKGCRKICKAPVVCDYVLTTYSYKQAGNPELVRRGGNIIAGGVFIGGAVLIIGALTGGIGFTIAGIVASAAIAGSAGTAGGIQVAQGIAQDIKPGLKPILEACFIYELVKRNFASIVNDDKLYLEIKD